MKKWIITAVATFIAVVIFVTAATIKASFMCLFGSLCS